MAPSFSEPIQWSSHELEMINTVDVFIHKPAIMKKAEGYLNHFKEAMTLELAGGNFPTGTDIVKGQLARGENNKGFPFLSLDIPQMFSKTEMFTFRTLFWWGHYLGYFLILKGEKLGSHLEQLIAMQNEPSFTEVLVSTAPTPWEWESFQKLPDFSQEELGTLVEKIQHLKIGRVFPMNKPHFSSLDWTRAGIETWRTVSSVTQG